MARWKSTWRNAAGAGAVVLLLWFPFVRDRRVPLLWAADLGFHELGHMVAIPFGQTVHFLAGSSTQVLVPVGLAVYFWLRLRDNVATGVMLAWAAASAHDASVYIADAPYQRLPLIGGHHDWNWLLSHWRVLEAADSLAGTVAFVGLLLGLGGLAIVLSPPARMVWDEVRDRRQRARIATLPVRERRRPR